MIAIPYRFRDGSNSGLANENISYAWPQWLVQGCNCDPVRFTFGSVRFRSSSCIEEETNFSAEFEPDGCSPGALVCYLASTWNQRKQSQHGEERSDKWRDSVSQRHHLHSEANSDCSRVTLISFQLSWVWTGLSVTESKKSLDWSLHENLSSPYFPSPTHCGPHLYPWFLTQEVSDGVRWGIEQDSRMG